MTLSQDDRAIVQALQAGLPLVRRPYAEIAERLGLVEAHLHDRLRALMADGTIRRIGIAPNHYRLGMTANGMTVWDVADDQADNLGAQVGALDFVTHCYLRPRFPPDWTYNLFAMVHGIDRAEVAVKRARIETLLGDACRAHDILYSTRILKKTGLRLADRKGAA